MGWIAVGVVLVAVAVIVIIKVTGGGTTNPPANNSAVTSGRDPAIAPASVTEPLATIPTSAFNYAGVAGMTSPLTVLAKQPALTSAGLPRFVYEGAEFCPYCAMDRWAMVSALDRFGSFTGLKQITSSGTDNPASIPTLSFLGSKYTSKYLVFTPYEQLDIDRNPLMTTPADATALYSTYDAPPNGTGTKFDGNNGGIPFVDIGNKYTSAGTPSAYQPVQNALENNGYSHDAIASALANPTVAPGPKMGVKYLLAEANFLSAAICDVDANKPASVCSSPGVKAATQALKASKPIS
jgi:hypothetical protein